MEAFHPPACQCLAVTVCVAFIVWVLVCALVTETVLLFALLAASEVVVVVSVEHPAGGWGEEEPVVVLDTVGGLARLLPLLL